MVQPTSEEKVVAGLVHLALLLNLAGLVATLVVYTLYRPKSAFVTRHAKQSLGLQVISLVLGWALPIAFGISAIGLFSLGAPFGFAPRATVGLLGVLLLGGLQIAVLVLAVIAAVRAFQGEEYRHPVFGQWMDSLGK